MLHRMIAAGIAVLGASCLAVPLAISAGMNGGMNRSAAPRLPLVNPGKPIPNPSPPSVHHHFAFKSFRDRFAFKSFRDRDRFQGAFPFWWGYGDYYPEVEAPYETQGYVYYPPQDFADRSRPPVFYPPGCRTDTVTVPSESGGERTINVTRCY